MDAREKILENHDLDKLKTLVQDLNQSGLLKTKIRIQRWRKRKNERQYDFENRFKQGILVRVANEIDRIQDEKPKLLKNTVLEDIKDQIIDDVLELERLECHPLKPSKISSKCQECDNFDKCAIDKLYWRRLPEEVVLYYLKDLKLNELRLYIYLNNCVDFRSDSSHHGRCNQYMTRASMIERYTGINRKHQYKYMDKLIELNLITKTTTKYHEGGEYHTENIFTVPWYKKTKELLSRADQLKRKGK